MKNTPCLVDTFLALKANLEEIPNMAYEIGKPQIIHHKIARTWRRALILNFPRNFPKNNRYDSAII